MRIAALLTVCACGTNTTINTYDAATTDATTDATSCQIDASYTCDVSSLSQAALLCTKWAGGTGGDNVVVSCPMPASGWDTQVSTRSPPCLYTWTKSGLPDLCGLPANDARRARLALTNMRRR